MPPPSGGATVNPATPGTGLGTLGTNGTGATNPDQGGGTRAPGGAIQRSCPAGTQWNEQARACQ